MKTKKIKTVRFKIDGRVAHLDDMYYHEEIKDVLSFSVPGANFSPAYKQWLRTTREYNEDPKHADEPSGWNGKHSMLKNGMLGVGLLLGYKDTLLKAGFKVKIVKWRHRPEIATRRGFISRDKKYKFQNDCVSGMLECVSKYGGGLVISATGTGKTKMAAQLASNMRGELLFIVDEIALLYQSQKEIEMWLKQEGRKEKVGVVGNSKFEPRRITIATIQTLHKFQDSARFRQWQKSIDIIIIDELHKQMSRRNFGVVSSIRPEAVIGLTATLELRKKNVAMKAMEICGPVVFKFPIKEGVEQGVLTQGIVVQIEVPDNKEEPHKNSYNVVFDQRLKRKVPKLDKYKHHVVYNNSAAKKVELLTTEALRRHYATAVLVDRIKHITKMEFRLRAHKPRMFYGAIASDKRTKSIEKFEKGSAELILANRVFTKGINVKRLDLVIDAANRANKNDCMQKFGRMVRLHSDKNGAIYLGVYITPAMEKVANSHRSAFKSARIPVVRIKWTDAKTALDVAEKLLKKTLKGNKK